MIEIKDLAYSYSRRGELYALKNISMTLEDGHIYRLLGENGVGKTTLLTLLCGLKKPNSGTITIDGFTPFNREPSFLSSVYYLQDEVYSEPISAIDFAARNGMMRENFSLDTFKELMTLFEVRLEQRMDKMSLGQLKKTHISFALACRTKYLFMDEPTNGIDIPSKAQFRAALTRHIREDATIIISTHQVRDLENVIDPLIILNCQQVLLNASLKEIAEKLFFDYGSEIKPGSLYAEMIPGGCIQVFLNTSEQESKVNIEALFNTVNMHKDIIRKLFEKQS